MKQLVVSLQRRQNPQHEPVAPAVPAASCPPDSRPHARVSLVKYGCTAKALGEISGEEIAIPCEQILGAGRQHRVEVVGPVLEEECKALHRAFWPGRLAKLVSAKRLKVGASRHDSAGDAPPAAQTPPHLHTDYPPSAKEQGSYLQASLQRSWRLAEELVATMPLAGANGLLPVALTLPRDAATVPAAARLALYPDLPEEPTPGPAAFTADLHPRVAFHEPVPAPTYACMVPPHSHAVAEPPLAAQPHAGSFRAEQPPLAQPPLVAHAALPPHAPPPPLIAHPYRQPPEGHPPPPLAPAYAPYALMMVTRDSEMVGHAEID